MHRYGEARLFLLPLRRSFTRMKAPSPIRIYFPLLVALSMAVGIWLGFRMRDQFPTRPFFDQRQSQPLEEALQLIQKLYVDTPQLDTLRAAGLEALLSKLDPHSVLIPATYREDSEDEIEGLFYGIGVEYVKYRDTFQVSYLIPGGPAEKAGVRPGDRFLRIGDRPVAGCRLSSDTLRRLLRARHEEPVSIRLDRDGKPLTLHLTRALIPSPSVLASYLVDRQTGYILIDQFTTNTYREFMTALTALKEKGMSSLVLDLRGNGGGVLDEAVEIADEFLDGEKLITYTQGRTRPRRDMRCRRPGQFETQRLTVLCNENTASASEVLLGALQDWDRATIIGEPTFGKGLVQEQFDLSDGSALRLTIARYYTPLGRSIQRSYANGHEAYYMSDKLNPDTTQRLNRTAFRSPKGKTLYEGEGITPDVISFSDTTPLSDTFLLEDPVRLTPVVARALFLKHDALASYADAADFSGRFHFGPDDIQLTETYFRNAGSSFSVLPVREQKQVQEILQAHMARMKWGKDGYYRVLNDRDPVFQRALRP